VIVRDGKILAACHNQVAEHHDATAHAEIEAIRKAGAPFEKGELRGATLYSTLQPSGMCTMASIWSKVGRVVYGAGRDDIHKMYFEARHVDTLAFVAKTGMTYRSKAAFYGTNAFVFTTGLGTKCPKMSREISKRRLNVQRMDGTKTLIITAVLDPVSFAWLDGLRREHFPA
jgi:tRNA(Arg) A34 adenosine deaminase TadA